MEGEGNERGQDREASVADGDRVLEDGESVLGKTASEIETPKAEVSALNHIGEGFTTHFKRRMQKM